MKKTLICILLTVCMVLGNAMVSLAAPAESRSFRDVHSDDWYYEACEYVYQHGYMIGTGDQMFSPDSQVTYAMAVQLLANMTENADLQVSEQPLNWYDSAVSWARRTGLEGGWLYGMMLTADPNQEMTRYSFAKLFYQYAIMTECNLNVSVLPDYQSQREYLAQAFTDIPADDWTIAPSVRDALIWSCEHGIIRGYEDGGAHLNDRITRAQLAQILFNAQDVLQQHRLTALCNFNSENVQGLDVSVYKDGSIGELFDPEDRAAWQTLIDRLNSLRVDYKSFQVWNLPYEEFVKKNHVEMIVSAKKHDPDCPLTGGSAEIWSMAIMDGHILIWDHTDDSDTSVYVCYRISNPEVVEELLFVD